MVAFHFSFSDRAGWKCDVCRKSGLSESRNCGFLPLESLNQNRVVWARHGVATKVCPVSVVTGESASLLEAISVWRRFGYPEFSTLSAKTVDAIIAVEDEIKKESHGRSG